ncbi:MAG: DUF2189 domain-containing protein [Hyphomicrobiales bacterium]|nr:DUF2189 domain-containing protein [Hyphomicrobiales bacterium]MCP5374187.1 DUF2189 domain-containing protein [Hyphomicrobiales bacterium]
MTEHSESASDGPRPGTYIVDEMAWVRDVPTDRVWQWMAAGWSDLKTAWPVSATYAACFTVVGLFCSFGLYFLEMPYLVLPAISGFLLVGPALGVGFYEVSRKIHAGERFGLKDAFLGYRRNTYAIMSLGITLVFMLQVWIRLSFTIFALNFPGVMPDWVIILKRAISIEGVYFGISITVLGSLFALVIFFACAFAMPLMVDRKTVLIPSMLTSVYAVWRNRRAMLLWAPLIVVIMTAGLLPVFVGLAITFPLIGHATWHAYRDVMIPADQDKAAA